jgi:hypothetical protein
MTFLLLRSSITGRDAVLRLAHVERYEAYELASALTLGARRRNYDIPLREKTACGLACGATAVACRR